MPASSSTFEAHGPECGRIDGVKATRRALPTALVGDHDPVPCVDGTARPYLNLDSAASTSALPAVAERVAEFLPTYSSVHRGAGYRSRQSTAAYERARESALAFAGRAESGGDVAIFCRNTTEAINHLAYRLAHRTPRHRGDDGDRASRQPASVGQAVRPALRRVRSRRHVHRRSGHRRSRRPTAPAAPGHLRSLERHGVDSPARSDHRRGPRPGSARTRRRRPARTARATPGDGGLPRLERAQDVRTLRCWRARRATLDLRRGRSVPRRRRRRGPRRSRRGGVDGPARP